MDDLRDASQPEALREAVRAAARVIAAADALLVGAGAGMGVDSGLPDFRGSTGFWNAYPRYRELGLDFQSLADPSWFASDPELAWGFYGHRMHLYRQTAPHAGFGLLLGWAAKMAAGAAVFTSNVDGQFQRAGFASERVYECHGSIHHLQCLRECGVGLLPADGYSVDLDPVTLRARPPLPSCPRCQGLLRPSILMFNDAGWNDERSHTQQQALAAWIDAQVRRRAKVAIVECGAGRAIPSVRGFCSRMATQLKTPLIRINPRESEADTRGHEHIALPTGALAGLRAIDESLRANAPSSGG